MEHTGISTQYQKHVAKCLFEKIEAGTCGDGKKRKQARTVVAEYMASDLQGAMKPATLSGKDIRRDLQNVYELLAVYTSIKRNLINLTEADFDELSASKLALLSPFLSMPAYQSGLDDAVALIKSKKSAKSIRELKGKLRAAAQPIPES